MRNRFFYCFFLLAFSSCMSNNKPPGSIIQPQKMQGVLWDVLRAQALASEMVKKDSSLNDTIELKALTKKVFEIHQTTAGDFNKSYSWYIKHPEAMTVIFDSIYTQYERSNDKIRVDVDAGDSIPKKNLLYEMSYKKYWATDSIIR